MRKLLAPCLLLACFHGFAAVETLGSAEVSARLGTAFPGIAVRVTDTAGRPVAHHLVTFSTEAMRTIGGFHHNADDLARPDREHLFVTTDSAGVAALPLVYGRKPGIAAVVADAGTWGRGQLRMEVLASAPPITLEMISGDRQRVAPGSDLQTPIRLRVRDSSGAPVARAVATAVSETGSFDTQTQVTLVADGDGVIEAPPFTASLLGPIPFFDRSEVQGTIGFGLAALEDIEGRGVSLVYSSSVPANMATRPLQDMWWGGTTENGWGVAIIDRAPDSLFIVLFVYDSAGEPIWYYIPAGHWRPGLKWHTTFEGNVYRTRGSPFDAYDPSSLQVILAGNASITFAGARAARLNLRMFDADIANGYFEKRLVRNDFSGDAPSPRSGLGDMWWGGSSANGWGMAILEQPGTLFSVWFTYNAAGRPTWFVMPGGEWLSTDRYGGTLYRSRSSPWFDRSYDPDALQVLPRGRFDLSFIGDSRATFDYSLDGTIGRLSLQRFEE